ncbi:MAG: hypothetical protein QM775_30275 [Pirellulales bacterium]
MPAQAKSSVNRHHGTASTAVGKDGGMMYEPIKTVAAESSYCSISFQVP